MRWRVLGPVLGLILLGALVFSFWPAPAPVLPPEPGEAPSAPRAPSTVLPVPRGQAEEPRVVVPPPTPAIAAPSPAPAPPPAAAKPEVLRLDPEPAPQHLKALGLTEADLEPLDGGPLFEVTKDGIRAAVQEGLPEIKECYEGWLQQNPALSGKMKVRFNIVEIPGRDRAKVMRVEIADGGMGHLAMEGCVRNVFKSMRFEVPRGGETNVTYPLTFQSEKHDAPPP